MSRFTSTRPSAAIIVAVIAVAFAVVGTAVAGTNGLNAKITKSKVKKIADGQIAAAAPNLSVGSAKSADTAKIASNILSANVLGDGTMLGSIPNGATSSKVATGDYRVSFGRSITGCTISASPANNTGPSLGFVAVGVASDAQLQVFTRSPTNVVADRPFYVQAICPG